ncbi:hypothetical protein Moror_4335 [Moniliophthora roreri MCA 2997]|uniref:Uncharacterized protein n=1 Tax=Moniliophthora roreri (strain MCA 2997) TaxID=1381753 RepID=V2XFZ3_MONRO|nr:hypothetical protein Moror_4335 [Moniliophthora roreri MCA 2997]
MSTPAIHNHGPSKDEPASTTPSPSIDIRKPAGLSSLFVGTPATLRSPYQLLVPCILQPESRYETPEDESSYLFSSTPGRDIYEISLRITDQTPRFFAMKYVHVGAEEANAGDVQVDWGVWSSAIGKSLSRQFISDEMQWHELRMEGGTDLVIHGGIKSRDAVNIIYMGLFSDRSVPRPSCYSRTMALSSWQLRLSIRHGALLIPSQTQ